MLLHLAFGIRRVLGPPVLKNFPLDTVFGESAWTVTVAENWSVNLFAAVHTSAVHHVNTTEYAIGCWRHTGVIFRDQPNSRFHGRDIFREIGLLPWKTPISVKFREIHDFSWIFTLLLSFMKVFRVLSTAFVRILMFAACHTSALNSWHVFTVLLTYIQSWVLT